MARREKLVAITDNGRDKGKVYRITEAPASRVEWFVARLFLAMARGGVDIGEDAAASGIAGLAALGIKQLPALPDADAKALLDEMMTTVEFVPDPSAPVPRRLVESDIEEIATRMRLRREIVSLHMDFSTADARSTSAAA